MGRLNSNMQWPPSTIAPRSPERATTVDLVLVLLTWAAQLFPEQQSPRIGMGRSMDVVVLDGLQMELR